MISEEKIALMTRLSAFEQEHERELEMKKKYKRRDYVSLKMLQSFIMSSLAFAIVLAGIVYADKVGAIKYRIEWNEVGRDVMIIYFIYLAMMLVLVFIFTRMHYDRLTDTVNEYKKELKNLHELYSKNEQQLSDMAEPCDNANTEEVNIIDSNSGI